MFNSIPFKVALVVSLSVHSIFLSAGKFFSNKTLESKENKVEITYLLTETVREKIPERIIENLPEKYDLEKKKTEEKNQPKKDTPDEVIKESAHEAPAEKVAYLEEEALKQLENYIQYYELIRERIKKHVAAKYRDSRSEGSVDVTFVVNRRGELEKLQLDQKNSTKDPRLVKTALKSIKDASPFPVFPESLDKQELVFSIAIVFKKE